MEEKIKAKDQAERKTVCRAIAQGFQLPEAAVAEAVYLASEWSGEVQDGAVPLVQTGDALPAGSSEEAVQSWLNITDRLEEQGIDLYAEIKSSAVTALYRFA